MDASSAPADPPPTLGAPATSQADDVWRPRSGPEWVGLNIAAGLAYWLTAWLGEAAAIGPLGVSVLWPPAGLGLALLLTWGPRLLPGLFIGSMLPYAMLQGVPGPDTQEGFTIALLVRAGSIGQWLLLLLMLGNWRQRVAQSGTRFAARYVAATASACLLAPTFGTAVLIGMGKLPAADWASAWSAWWVGDVAGILIVTPLLLFALQKAMRGHFVANQTFPCLSLGLGLTLAGTALLGNLDQAARQDRARAELMALSRSVEAQMALAASDLARLADLHYAVQLTPEEFDEAGVAIRVDRPWLSGFAYLPLIKEAQRPALEAQLQQALRSIDTQGRLVQAPPQSQYWPVTRLSPMGGQEARLGVDEGSDPLRRMAIQLALQSRRPSLTPVLDRMQHADDDEWGVLIYQPVYQERGAPGLVPEATGLVSASVQLRALVTQALRDRPQPEFSILLLSTGAQRRGLLIENGGLQRSDAQLAEQWQRGLRQSDRIEQKVRFADSDWQVLLALRAPGAWVPPSGAQIAASLFGLGSTALLTALLVARARRDEALARWREELELEVGRRTQDLASLNAQLREQALQRENVAAVLRRNSEQLAQRETLLRTLLRHIPFPVWVKDPGGAFLVVNTALEQLLGRSARQLVGQRSESLLRADLAAQVAALDGRALRQREAVQEEMTVVDAQGRERLTVQTRVALRDETGQHMGVLGLAQDITEQRQRETTLRRFRVLADSAAQGFALARIDGRIVYANATALRWFGESGWHDGLARHARRYFTPAAWRRVVDEVLPAVRAGDSWNGLLPLLERGNQVLDRLQLSFFPLREPGAAPRHVALLLTDISERLGLQAELELARDRAEDANRAKSEFLSSISHEIRTPLNAVLGYAQLLAEDRSIGAQSRSQITSIHQAGERLLRLINDVLDLSKIEAGVIELVPELCALQDELGELVQLMRARAAQGRLQLDWQDELPAGLQVLLDRGKFGQVVLNLLGNAIKFTPAGGRVLVRARLDAGQDLRLLVEDTGPGIAPEELAELFQPFRQGKSGNKLGGTGLGLTLARRLAQAMGGELWLDSSLGQGTRAHLRLPLRRIEAGSTEAGNAAQRFGGSGWSLEPGSRCRVLVVEDDPDSQGLLQGLLLNLGCQVDCANDGQQALTLSAERTYDIVFSDIQMPVMDGLALRQALAAQANSKDWPVVAVTASSLLMSRDDFLAQGFAEYIPKPFAFSMLLDALVRLTGVQLRQLAQPTAGASETETPTTAAAPQPASGRSAVLSLQMALGWAREGRALELRQWLDGDGELLPADIRQAMRDALARYDVQRAESLLLAHVQQAHPDWNSASQPDALPPSSP